MVLLNNDLENFKDAWPKRFMTENTVSFLTGQLISVVFGRKYVASGMRGHKWAFLKLGTLAS